MRCVALLSRVSLLPVFHLSSALSQHDAVPTAKGREKRRTLVKRDPLGIGLLRFGSFLLSFSFFTREQRGNSRFIENASREGNARGKGAVKNGRFGGVRRSVEARSVRVFRS